MRLIFTELILKIHCYFLRFAQDTFYHTYNSCSPLYLQLIVYKDLCPRALKLIWYPIMHHFVERELDSAPKFHYPDTDWLWNWGIEWLQSAPIIPIPPTNSRLREVGAREEEERAVRMGRLMNSGGKLTFLLAAKWGRSNCDFSISQKRP